MRCISAAYVGMQCLYVCPSVTFADHVKTNKHIFEFFSPSGSHTILVFVAKRGGDIPTEASNTGGLSRFWSNSWVSKIAGRAKCQKQLSTTMQCRSHSRRLTSECLFVTAYSMGKLDPEIESKDTFLR